MYQPSGRRPIMRVMISTLRAMSARSTVLGNELIVDPALSVTGNLEAAACDLRRSLRIALQRHADGVNRRLDAVLLAAVA